MSNTFESSSNHDYADDSQEFYNDNYDDYSNFYEDVSSDDDFTDDDYYRELGDQWLEDSYNEEMGVKTSRFLRF